MNFLNFILKITCPETHRIPYTVRPKKQNYFWLVFGRCPGQTPGMRRIMLQQFSVDFISLAKENMPFT